MQAGDSTAAVEGNADEGIAVNSYSLQLNGGRIRSLWFLPSHEAELAHLWLPFDARHKVDGSKKAPLFESASVDGTALTVTFDEALDAGSVPAPSCLPRDGERCASQRGHRGRGHRRRDGDADPGLGGEPEGDTVTVRYTRPSANPLQSTLPAKRWRPSPTRR